MLPRDQGEDRAASLLKSVEPDLLLLLKNAPLFGMCGLDFYLVDGQILRVGIRTEITHKAKPHTGGAK
jgi:hypothetical protein